MGKYQLSDFQNHTHIIEFDLLNGNTAQGTLILDEQEATAQITSRDSQLKNIANNYIIKGTFWNGIKCSLISSHKTGVISEQAIPPQHVTITRNPFWITFGDFHVDTHDAAISHASFSTDQLHFLFSFADISGMVYHDEAKPIVESILKLKGEQQDIGKFPFIFYSTGNQQIFETQTEWGTIGVYHGTTLTMSTGRENQHRHQINVLIDFDVAVDFTCAVNRTKAIFNLLELLIGRPQNFTALHFHKTLDRDQILVHDCSRTRFDNDTENNPRAHPIITQNTAPYLVRTWIQRHASWHLARSRYWNGFNKMGLFGNDRLISAANMFELLPKDALPDDIELSDDMENAITKTQELFKNLRSGDTYQREQILSTLGRIHKPTMKQKIRHRILTIDTLMYHSGLQQMFAAKPLSDVTDAAVDTRNYFVHGTMKQPAYWERQDLIIFFTRTLEFVFALSDLLESGFSVAQWLKQPVFRGGHPFDTYLYEYESWFDEFNEFKMHSSA